MQFCSIPDVSPLKNVFTVYTFLINRTGNGISLYKVLSFGLNVRPLLEISYKPIQGGEGRIYYFVPECSSRLSLHTTLCAHCLFSLYLIGEKMSGESDENFEWVTKFSPDELKPRLNKTPTFFPR